MGDQNKKILDLVNLLRDEYNGLDLEYLFMSKDEIFNDLGCFLEGYFLSTRNI